MLLARLLATADVCPPVSWPAREGAGAGVPVVPAFAAASAVAMLLLLAPWAAACKPAPHLKFDPRACPRLTKSLEQVI